MIMNSRPGSPSFVSTFPDFTSIGVTSFEMARSSFFEHSEKIGIRESVWSMSERAIPGTPCAMDALIYYIAPVDVVKAPGGMR